MALELSGVPGEFASNELLAEWLCFQGCCLALCGRCRREREVENEGISGETNLNYILMPVV